MPTVITPAAAPAWPATFDAPADGDLANAASVNVAFQAVADAGEAARLAHFGAKCRPRYRSNAAAPTTQILVEALGYVVVTVGGLWKVILSTVSYTFTAATKLGGALAASTRYYFYAFSNAGALDIIVTTDAPDAMLRYRGAAPTTDNAYIGTFVTDAGAAIVPFCADNGIYLYLRNCYDGPGVSAGNSTVYASVDLDPAAPLGIPPHSQMALVFVEVVKTVATGAGQAAYCDLRSSLYATPTGGVHTIYGTTTYQDDAANDQDGHASDQVWMPCTSGGLIEYRVGPTGATSATIALVGFAETHSS